MTDNYDPRREHHSVWGGESFEEEDDMAIKPTQMQAQIDRRLEQLTREQDRLLAKRDELDEVLSTFGEDDWPVETVLFFKIQFNSSGRSSGIAYRYAAVKVTDLRKAGWYVTGRDGAGPKTWEDLLALWTSGRLVELSAATEWDVLAGEPS